jgi:hypothetical protein
MCSFLRYHVNHFTLVVKHLLEVFRLRLEALTDIPSESRGHSTEEQSLRQQVLQTLLLLVFWRMKVNVLCSFVYILGIN